MALKDWSIGKIVGVMFGSFFALAIVALVGANVVKKRRASSSVVNVTSNAPMMTPTAGAGIGPRPHDGLLDEQLAQLSRQISTLQQQVDRQAQKTQQNNQSIMQNFNTLQGEIKALAVRVTTLEHPTTGPVQVVKTPEKPRVPETKRLASRAKPLPRHSGYHTEAVVGRRAWMRVNGVEATRAVGEDLPKASEAARIEAVSADSGVYVLPVKPH